MLWHIAGSEFWIPGSPSDLSMPQRFQAGRQATSQSWLAHPQLQWQIQTPHSKCACHWQTSLGKLSDTYSFANHILALCNTAYSSWDVGKPEKNTKVARSKAEKTLSCRQAVVSWTTANQTANPLVQYGTASGGYTQNVTATYDNYTRTDMCGAIANSTGWTDPGDSHRQT